MKTSNRIIEVVRLLGKLTIQADKRRFYIVIALNSLLGLSNGANLFLDKKILDTLGAGIKGDATASSYLILFTATRLLLYLSRDFIRRTAGYHQVVLEMNVYNHIQLTCARKNASIEAEIAEDPEFKNRFTKIERTTGNRAARLVGVIAEVPENTITLLTMFTAVAVLKPEFVIIPFIVAVPSLIAAIKNIRDTYQLETQLSPLQRTRNLAGYYLSNNSNLLELRLLRAKDILVEKYKMTQDRIADLRKGSQIRRRKRNFISNIPAVVANIGISLYAGLRAIAGEFTLGSAFTVTRAVDQLGGNINQVFTNLSDLYENHLYITDVNWLLSLPERNENEGEPFPIKLSTGIEFKNVWFKYPKTDKWILKELNLTIDPTENIALVGENGAGKSTLVKLLCGLYEPTKGQILINGKPVSSYRRDEYWNKLAVMFQDVETYGFSARESIGYGNTKKINDIESIKSAATFANIDSWVSTLSEGYNTPLIRDFEKGINPSGGQKQRLALARTLMKDSRVVILDEPTSNMDPAAEEEIFTRLLEWGRQKLLVFVSHRFSTVRQADRILVIESGKLIESGTHDELMKIRQGLYKKLFTLQAKNYA